VRSQKLWVWRRQRGDIKGKGKTARYRGVCCEDWAKGEKGRKRNKLLEKAKTNKRESTQKLGTKGKKGAGGKKKTKGGVILRVGIGPKKKKRGITGKHLRVADKTDLIGC